VATSMPELDTLSRAVALRKQLKCQFRLALFYWAGWIHAFYFLYYRKLRDMIKIFYSNAIGFMIGWGINYEKRPYITIDIPFCFIQIFFKK
jgi:hypothetical protein